MNDDDMKLVVLRMSHCLKLLVKLEETENEQVKPVEYNDILQEGSRVYTRKSKTMEMLPSQQNQEDAVIAAQETALRTLLDGHLEGPDKVGKSILGDLSELKKQLKLVLN